MATAVHESDVVVLAGTLLGLAAPRDSGAAYRRGTQLYALLESDDFSELTIDVSGASSRLRSTLSALDAVQLAFDAAAAAVAYRIRFAGDYQERDGDPDESVVRDRLRDLVSEAGWELEVLELRAGSFKAKLKAIKKDERTPSRLLSIAVLAAAVVSVIFPPVTAAAGVVVAVGGVGVAFAAKPGERAKTAKEVLSEELESRQAATKEAAGPVGDARVVQLRQTHDEARSHQLEADFDELGAGLSRVGDEGVKSVDHASASEAIEEVTFTLAKGSTPDGGSA
ncbi:hypothetical protein [Terrabacter carboxydivorans]|uniref:Uncharacterized protein n=1 Tax=Terrabacter carboxydivorans TaxID=619730 RepID=A0ABN3MHN7_9MICO